MTSKGLVVKNLGSSYLVESLSDGSLVDCRIKGRFRLKGIRTTNPVAVGDIVGFEQGADDAVITAIEPRRNYIIRRSTNLSKDAHIIAANLDNVFLVVSLHAPATSYEFIDRFLITCELYALPAVIVLHKVDLCDEEEIEEFEEVYAKAGYDVIRCSATAGFGIGDIKRRMMGGISLFSGNSGVGKSTIIKAILPGEDIRIGDISVYDKGKHTTTFSQMYKVAEDTYLIDTPGIKGFGLVDTEKAEICRYFPDLFRRSADCRFYNCTHTHEPGCAVIDAVEEGSIAWQRYESYLNILEDDKDKYR